MWESKILKADEDQRLVYGVPLRVNAPDSQDDIIKADEIEKAAHQFMIDSQKFDDNHQTLVPTRDAYVVESYLAPVDFEMGGEQVYKGDWVLVTKIFNDELWEAIKAGEYRGYSIRGMGKRVSVDE